ncbi:unnamed protein product [Camellia sinensis]
MDPRPYLLPFLFLCLFFILCSQLASMPTRVSCSLRGRNTNPDGGAGAGKNGDRQITLFFRSIKRTLSLNKVSSTNSQFDHLSDGILQEILLRLPLKSLFKFKCVSKNWFSRISDPFFSRLYVSRKLNSPSLPPFRLLYRYVYVSHFPQILNRLSPDSPRVYPSHNFSVLSLSTFREYQQDDQYKILASSNGLLLFCSLKSRLLYYVSDPVTKQWVCLPNPNTPLRHRRRVFVNEGFIALSDHNNLITSYKVVRLQWHSWESSNLNFETYSSETGEWDAYRLSCSQPVRLLKKGCPFVYNGAVHWFCYRNRILAFDPYKNVEECRLIYLPNYRDFETERMYEGLYRLCEECQGKLRYFEAAPHITEPFCFSMWVMKDYDNGVWDLVHRATRGEIWSVDPHICGILLDCCFLPLAYHPFNLDIVYLRCKERTCIVAYNIRTKQLEVSCNLVGLLEDLSWRVVIPFVLPTWPRPLPKQASGGH